MPWQPMGTRVVDHGIRGNLWAPLGISLQPVETCGSASWGPWKPGPNNHTILAIIKFFIAVWEVFNVMIASIIVIIT